MQKFKVKLKDTPRDAPQVPCSVSTSLNKEEILSEMSKVLTLNNLEVDLRQHKGGQDLRVPVIACVLNVRGEPLDPCSARKARKLIKEGKAKVVKGTLFYTIQLTYATGQQVQKNILGIDSGKKNIGFSVVTNKKELASGTLVLDDKTHERLTEKKMYSRNRRNKLWYRKPRFNNRVKKAGWLPPSVQRRFDTHITLINKIKRILPIEKVIVEVGNFDIQKIDNPDISGVQYQQGSMFGYQNMRSFLMARESGKCQLCSKGFSRGNPSHIHHIERRIDGGTNRSKGLALLHEKCHNKLHRTKSFNLLKKNKTYKDATFMSIIRHRFKEVLPDCELTYGYETFVKRNALGIEKTHYNDAFVIAGGDNQIRFSPISLKQKHKNNRVLQLNRKGFKPSIRRQRYSIQPYDIITVANKRYVVKGSHSYGKVVLCIDGVNKFNFGIKKIDKVFHTKTIYIE